MKKIPLTRGLFALVDDEDYARLIPFTWVAARSRNIDYATGNIRAGLNKRKTIFMHRMIMRPSKSTGVDHINGNGLDNRRANLRLATVSQNRGNCKIKNLPKSGFRGVRRHHNKWHSIVGFKRKQIYLGTFDTPEMAFEAYKTAHTRLFGSYSVFSRP